MDNLAKRHSEAWFISKIGKPVISMTTGNDFIVYNAYHARYLFEQQDGCNKRYQSYRVERIYSAFVIPTYFRMRKLST